MRIRLALLVTVMLSVTPILPSAAADRGDRFALVIGNSKYPDADAPLKEPINDARDVAGELKRDPQLESILQRRAQELGIERGSRLDRVLKAPTIEQALNLSVRDLGLHRDRGLSL